MEEQGNPNFYGKQMVNSRKKSNNINSFIYNT